MAIRPRTTRMMTSVGRRERIEGGKDQFRQAVSAVGAVSVGPVWASIFLSFLACSGQPPEREAGGDELGDGSGGLAGRGLVGVGLDALADLVGRRTGRVPVPVLPEERLEL